MIDCFDERQRCFDVGNIGGVDFDDAFLVCIFDEHDTRLRASIVAEELLDRLLHGRSYLLRCFALVSSLNDVVEVSFLFTETG